MDYSIAGVLLSPSAMKLEMLGKSSSSFQTWEDALKAYEELGDDEKAAALHRKMGWRYTAAYASSENTQKALDHYASALKLFARLPEGPSVAYLYHHLAEWHWLYGEAKTAREFSEKCIQLAKRYGLSEINALCCIVLGFTSPIDDLAAALENFRKAEELPIKSGRAEFDLSVASGRVEFWLGYAFRLATDDTKTALIHLHNCVKLVDKVGAGLAIFVYGGSLALWGYFPSGEWSKARELASGRLAWPGFEFFSIIRQVSFAALGSISLREGKLAEAEEELLKGYAATQELPEVARFLFASNLHANLGRLYLDKGDLHS